MTTVPAALAVIRAFEGIARDPVPRVRRLQDWFAGIETEAAR